jgi:branched-chain amino acid transport system permease protein
MSAAVQTPEPAVSSAAEEHIGLRPAAPAVGLDRKLLLRAVAVAVVVGVVGLFVPTFVTDPYYMGIAADGVVLGILALGIGFLAHRSGLISLGHTAFYGGSAYGIAIATTHWGWGPVQGAIFAVAGGTLLAVAVGALVIRTPGMGFLMLTLAFGQALYQVSTLTSLRDVTGAFDGLGLTWAADATFFGMTQAELGAADTFWPIAWALLVLIAFGLWVAGRSRFGIVLEAIRENEERARFSGYNTFLPRLAAFTISGFCASIAGVLFALKASYVSPDVLSFVLAGDSLIAAIVGGLTILLGPVVGAILYIYAQGEFSETGNLQLYTGLAMIVAVVFLPGGVTGSAAALFKRARARLGKKGGAS